MKSNTLKQH